MSSLIPTSFIWFDGKLVPWAEANIHVLSHGLHYGTGYFEGIRAYRCTSGGSAVFRLREHMQRFINSGKIMGLPQPYDLETLEKAVLETMETNKMAEGYIRPLAFAGYGGLNVSPAKNPINTIIATWPWGAYLGEEGMSKGVRVKTSSYNRIHPNTHMGKAKGSGNYVNSVLAKMEALQDGYDEAMMLDVNGLVAEASGENIFIVRGNTIKTPPLTSALEGISRDALMSIATDLGYTVKEAPLTRDEVYIADEVFFCGTAAEVTPVREVDNRTIGSGEVGPVAKTLQKAFFAVVKGENATYTHWLTSYSV